jgi:hypothetical protein
MRAMRLLLPVLIVLAAAAPAAASSRYDVDGPRSVHAGERVAFTVTGAKPGERVEVSLAPTINRGGNCCGIDVITDARADANGEAILHFKWPRYYYDGTEKVRWRRGTKADVYVIADSGRGRHVVRIRR